MLNFQFQHFAGSVEFSELQRFYTIRHFLSKFRFLYTVNNNLLGFPGNYMSVVKIARKAENLTD